ncbi:NADH-quinone oxidoreductase subunit A [Tautonia marina]|uniref:NADH-quinone oxidoreductase subunit A n=1 Tax=Tautonia marina TaxID=2653855 RepID=UPI001261332E|nr:NADH-quinone oxidoreductase subunit A [Tautonia marina]
MGLEFTPIFLMILVGISVAVGMLTMSYLLSPGRRKTQSNRVKQMPYESGMDPIGDARQRFDIRYYLVAIEFLIFDVELLLLYPWAVGQWHRDETSTALGASFGVPLELRTMAFFGVLAFLGILVAGFAYTWKKGVYEWR